MYWRGPPAQEKVKYPLLYCQERDIIDLLLLLVTLAIAVLCFPNAKHAVFDINVLVVLTGIQKSKCSVTIFLSNLF